MSHYFEQEKLGQTLQVFS